MNHFEAVSRILVHSVAFDKMSDINPTISDVGNPDPPAWSELSWLRSRRWGQEQGWRETSQVRQSRGAQPGLASWPRQRAESSPAPALASRQEEPGAVIPAWHPLASSWHLTVHFLTRRSSQSPLSQVSSSSQWSDLGIKRTQHYIYISRGKGKVLQHSWRIISVRRIKDWVSRKFPPFIISSNLHLVKT